MPLEIGTVAGWVTAISSLGVFGLAGWLVKWNLGKGRLGVDTKKIVVDAEALLRTHMAVELQSLRDQIIKNAERQADRERDIDERWRKLLQDSEDRHDECVAQRERLSQKLIELETRFLGTVRQFVLFQKRIAENIPEEARSPEINGMLASLQPFENAVSLGVITDPNKSDALNIAEGAEFDANQVAASTKETRKEIERTEGENGE